MLLRLLEHNLPNVADVTTIVVLVTPVIQKLWEVVVKSMLTNGPYLHPLMICVKPGVVHPVTTLHSGG